MPLIPIGVDIRLRRRPVGNWLLIGVNVAVFVATQMMRDGLLARALEPLHAAVPALHQYLTYQFRHGDVAHLLGNMIFLWIFGNAVCDRLGSVNYVLFYLAGGCAAGVVYAAFNDTLLVGASGSIAAVTTAFLVLFPRVHITLILWFFVVTTLELPAMLVIVGKIILWDNIAAPLLDRGAFSNVAYSAHLGGYAFGFAIGMLLLALRALPRQPFDLLALWQRWGRQRAALEELPTLGPARARPMGPEPIVVQPVEPPPRGPAAELLAHILDRLTEHDLTEAARLYLRLAELDPQAVLPRDPQVSVANHLARTQHYAAAAQAYERYLAAYPLARDAAEVRLWAGMLYRRYLNEPGRAAVHLRAALEGLIIESQRRLALEELQAAEAWRIASGGSPDQA